MMNIYLYIYKLKVKLVLCCVLELKHIYEIILKGHEAV